MILVQLPELAVDDIEVFIGEELCDLVDVFLILQETKDCEEVGSPEFANRDSARPGTVHREEDAGNHLAMDQEKNNVFSCFIYMKKTLLLKQIFQKRLYQHHARTRGFQKA